MKTRIFLHPGLIVALSVLCSACASLKAPPADLVLINANLVSPETGEVSRDSALAIRSGRIVALGRDAERLPATRTIDLHGAYVAPGLTDSHVHLGNDPFAALLQSGEPTPESRNRALGAYLAEGVTSVVVLSGSPDLLRLRDAVDRGEAPGPRLVVASPMVAGARPILPPPVTRTLEREEDAPGLVAELRAEGYDLIKSREDLTPKQAGALSRAAASAGIPMAGHLPGAARVPGDFFAGPGTTAAHLYDLLQLQEAGDGDFAGLAEALARNGGQVITTLSVHQNILAKNSDFAATLRAPCVSRLDPQLRTLWTGLTFEPSSGSYTIARELVQQGRLLRALQDAGVPLLAGTDSGAPTIPPGCSLADELRLLVRYGLTPREALASATTAPARAFARLANTGSLKPGHAADLIIMDASPLADISALVSPRAVVRAGVFFGEAELRRLRED